MIKLAVYRIVAAVGSAAVLPAALQSQAVRDSAGIRIVVSDRPKLAADAAWRLDATPSLVIGNRDGDRYELSRVTGAIRLHDGSIVVAVAGSFELRYYDSTGTYVKAVGRRGQGPGEFTRIESLASVHGDTLVVLDQGTASFFTAAGTFVRAINPRNPPIAGLDGPPLVLGVFRSGARVVASSAYPAPRARGDRWLDVRPFAIVNEANVRRATLEGMPFMQFAMDVNPQRPWFGAQYTSTSDSAYFYYGIGDTYDIRAYDLDGRLVRVIRRKWTPSKVSKADIDAYVVAWGKRWIRETGEAAERRYADLRDDPYASTLPAYSQLVVDGAGRLWARAPNTIDAAWAGQLNGVPLASSVWSVFDPQGRWVTDVSMPARFLVKEIGTNYVLGVARDDNDVETVVLYRITAGSSR